MIILVIGSGLFVLGILLVLLGKISFKKKQPEYLGSEMYDLEAEPAPALPGGNEYQEALENLKREIEEIDIRMERSIESTKKRIEELRSDSNTIKVKSGRYISYSDLDGLKKNLEDVKVSNISVEDIKHISDVMRRNVQKVLRDNMDILESSINENEAQIERMKAELSRVKAALKSSDQENKISREVMEAELQNAKKEIKILKSGLPGDLEAEKPLKDIPDRKIELQNDLFQQQEIVDFIRKGMETMGKKKKTPKK
jgi:hypothetical protein